MASQGLILDRPTTASLRGAAPSTRPNLTPEFLRFGTWGPTIRVARDGTILALARWIALNVPDKFDSDELWQRCQEANPRLFRSYRIAKLDAPSFFLPAGEVVFRVEENPSQIPESPPEGVLMRHVEALEAFPHATTFLLQPVFISTPAPRLYNAAELRLEALGDQREAMRIARQFGWAFRTAVATRRRLRQGVERVGRWALRIATRLMERLASDAPSKGRSQAPMPVDPAIYWATHRTLTRL